MISNGRVTTRFEKADEFSRFVHNHGEAVGDSGRVLSEGTAKWDGGRRENGVYGRATLASRAKACTVERSLLVAKRMAGDWA